MRSRPRTVCTRLALCVALSAATAVLSVVKLSAAERKADDSQASKSAVVEPWTDKRLPPIPGLVWWLDAAAIPAARRQLSLPAVPDGGTLAEWHDGSLQQRRVTQSDAQARPKLLRLDCGAAGPAWVVRFDGQDDHLQAVDFHHRAREFTLFVAAAPHSNLGFFRGFVALHERNRRDYETGLTLDLNAPASPQLQDVNLEGRGFGGARNLLTKPAAFGTLQIFECVGDAARKQVTLAVDGQPPMSRPFAPSELLCDGAVVGARYYENGAGPQKVQGFLHGDVAEVLLYQRALLPNELQAVRGYLQAKHAALRDALPKSLERLAAAEQMEPLATVKNPPPIQMLIPGFRVMEAPVALTNVNNLRYRPDGKLYALGYSGDIWLLDDQDHDGVPDASKTFFTGQGKLRGPIGMAVIPAGHRLLTDAAASAKTSIDKVRGVVVASKGKVSAILDVDGDDAADQERVIASGWKEITQNVDAIGLAIDPRDGAIYFGLGTAAYNNAYLLDDQGRSAFDLASERGTIQRIEPDLSRRSTVCTGVRFTIGLEFNASHDLFAADQEGATWLPNGNPFDELLLIEPDKHYGFPPRHPRHLPQVFDEPSLFDYGPQHQSTCGMTFNVPAVAGGATFGPASWRGDLLVCGESRGKLYRTKLVRDGQRRYVASNELIGCLSMLTVDCRVSPRGDLLIACHSGGPDWGTGPTGAGKLFVVRYDRPELPQPLAAWAASPREVRVTFDRPLAPDMLRDLASRTKITAGEFVAAGDRFESIRPGYAVTMQQLATPRRKVAVHAASVTADRRTLLLATDPHEAAVSYAITLPGMGRESSSAAGAASSASEGPSPLPQHPEVDLAYSLQGVVAHWQPRDADDSPWESRWLHLDPLAARALAFDPSDAAQRESQWNRLSQFGVLTLSTQLQTYGLFEPAVQPGSSLDYEPSSDSWVTSRAIVLRSTRAFRASIGVEGRETASKTEGAEQVVRVSIDRASTKLVPLVVTLSTGEGEIDLRVEWEATTRDNATHRGSLALQRLLLPWAQTETSTGAKRSLPLAKELEGGNWGRGRQIFLSDEAGCVKCHRAHGKGGEIGPDLSNLVQRDYASVLRDVTTPSFAINPDFLTYVATLEDGRVLTGALRSDGEHLMIGNKEGQVVRVARSDVEQLTPSPLSIMPEGLPAKLGPERMRDLMTFLLSAAPRMPADALQPPPAPRRRAEVDAVLAGAASLPPPSQLKPLRVLLVAGAKDHGPGEHDYPAWKTTWSQLLSAADGVTVESAMEWPSAEQIRRADTIVFFQKGSWNAERAQAIDAHLARGGGLVYIHWAVEAGPEAPAFAQRIGLASEAAKLKFRHGPLDLTFAPSPAHPIARNLNKVHFHDESYWQMQGDARRVRVLGTGVEDGAPQPLFWTLEPSQGRVFVSILGHYSWTFDDPLFRILLLRGIAWTAREDVDRLRDLATLGVPLNP
ncbi:MAG: ThuA domain-containing protein [Pirellulales bacterium]